jgi:hypothetical protein
MPRQVGLEDLKTLQPAVAHSMERMLSPAFSDADFAALDQRFELSYEAYGALKVKRIVTCWLKCDAWLLSLCVGWIASDVCGFV